MDKGSAEEEKIDAILSSSVSNCSLPLQPSQEANHSQSSIKCIQWSSGDLGLRLKYNALIIIKPSRQEGPTAGSMEADVGFSISRLCSFLRMDRTYLLEVKRG